jgi:hypothetical protein
LTGGSRREERLLFSDSRCGTSFSCDIAAFVSGARVRAPHSSMEGVSAAAEPVLIDCGAKFSFFFDLISKEFAVGNAAPLHRICTIMRKMRVQCFTREELQIQGEVEEERAAAEKRVGMAVAATASRFTFFRDTPQSGNWRDCKNEEILGYAVLVRLTWRGDGRTYILEAGTRIPSLRFVAAGVSQVVGIANHYVHCHRELRSSIGPATDKVEFAFEGTFFCQQNNLTHVCAHAALRIAINSSPVRPGGKLTNKRINDLLQIDHAKRSVGALTGQDEAEGLRTPQIAEVVKQMGWSPVIVDFVANPEIDYEDFVYPVVESACPLILGIHNVRIAHVVTVLGHTLSTDRWTPEARRGYGGYPISPYISTTAWADHFIVSDDNFGPHVTLPTESIRNIFVPKHNPNLHAGLAIGLMPLSVTTSGYEAEQLASSMASRLLGAAPSPWERWFEKLKTQPLVCRTLLRFKGDYVATMSATIDSEMHGLDPAAVASLNGILPDQFWVTELTVPNLYSGNKHKLGEVICKADATRDELSNGTAVILIWVPGIICYMPAQTGQLDPWSFTGHIPLLRGSEPKNLFEW